MATAQDIQTVKDNLPSDAASDGWDDAKIEGLLDGGLSTSRATRSYWANMAANTASFVSVSESGSSRDLASIHKHAMAMLKYWDDRIADEENAGGGGTTGRGISFNQATRV